MERREKRIYLDTKTSRLQAVVVNDNVHILKAVQVVTDSWKELTGISHVLQSVSDFVDSACETWTFERVSSSAPLGCQDTTIVNMLDRLLLREWPALRQSFRLNRFRYNLREAYAKNKLQIVDWWLAQYFLVDQVTSREIVRAAIYYNRVNVLESLDEKGVLPDPKTLTFKSQYAETTYWLRERGYTLLIDVFYEIGQNNLDFMKWVHAYKTKHIIQGLDLGIAVSSRVEMAQWLIKAFPDTKWREPSDVYFPKYDMEMIKWMEKFVWSGETVLISRWTMARRDS